MDLIVELRQVVKALGEAGVPHALCGGLAMAVYGLPRSTMDIDLLVPADAVEKALDVVEGLGFVHKAEPMVFKNGRILIRRVTRIDAERHETVVLDLVSLEREGAEVLSRRLELDWAGENLNVVSAEDLVVLKTLRGSGQDLDDIAYLRGLLDET